MSYLLIAVSVVLINELFAVVAFLPSFLWFLYVMESVLPIPFAFERKTMFISGFFLIKKYLFVLPLLPL